MQKDLLPIMIGYAPAAADSMLRDLGGKLHVLDDKRRGLLFLRRDVRCYKLSGLEPDIVAMHLKGLCSAYPDRLPVVGATPEKRGLLNDVAPLIESFCVILREDNLERCKALKNSGTDR